MGISLAVLDWHSSIGTQPTNPSWEASLQSPTPRTVLEVTINLNKVFFLHSVTFSLFFIKGKTLILCGFVWNKCMWCIYVMFLHLVAFSKFMYNRRVYFNCKYIYNFSDCKVSHCHFSLGPKSFIEQDELWLVNGMILIPSCIFTDHLLTLCLTRINSNSFYMEGGGLAELPPWTSGGQTSAH